jgi:hypothetical protein
MERRAECKLKVPEVAERVGSCGEQAFNRDPVLEPLGRLGCFKRKSDVVEWKGLFQKRWWNAEGTVRLWTGKASEI